jgi:hypothetical protein
VILALCETAVVSAIPSAFTYFENRDGGRRGNLFSVLRRLGLDLLPSDDVARRYAEGLSAGDPIAERFVAETFHGALGARAARALLDQALDHGIDNVADAPESMRALFAEFEDDPPWLDRALVEEGAAVWRRWGYSLGAVGDAGTMDTYTEASLALPLSLSGGYAGDRAMHRYLETTHWWLEVSRPGAILTPGSLARAISLKVRVMHVSVRARVADHPEWDGSRWGLPISQSEMLLTLLGGSVAPGLGLTLLGHLTSPRELRAVLHFNRYCGHLVGVRCDGYFPESAMDAWRLLVMADTGRANDAGDLGRELVESFVPAFAPTDGLSGLGRWRARFHYWLQAGYAGLFMLPWHRRRYDLPSALPGMALLLGRAPYIVGCEVARRISPAVDWRWQRRSHARWERWYVRQSGGRGAEFDAGRSLRR